ncbi:MAG: Bifunctional ligase/repressor BirA [Chlamydiia bacterium]|nr:Bifunctional ligase/repressor BirA [Chlamydiia bacterium]
MFDQVFARHFETIPSTHLFVKEAFATFDDGKLHMITASHQTHGVGRGSNQWASLGDTGCKATFFFRWKGSSQATGNLGQVLSLSVIGLIDHYGVTGSIKWPNDIRVEKKKLGGVLCHVVDGNGVVISVGVNVNAPAQMLAKVDQPATSMLVEGGEAVSLPQFNAGLGEQFRKDLNQFMDEGFTPFVDKYKRHLEGIDEVVSFRENGVRQEVVLKGVDARGHMWVTDVDGTNERLITCCLD